MKKTLVGAVIGAVTVTAIGAIASYKPAETNSPVAIQPADTIQSATATAEQATGAAAPAPVQPPAMPATKPAVRQPQYAEVLAVTPVTESINTPREECRDEVVTQPAPTKDPHQVAGTVAGAVVGGVVGNQFGGGKGKKLMTVAGAVAGGYAGNKVQEGMQAANTTTTTERRCTTVTDTHEQVIGYDVAYRWNGQDRVARMDQAPGARIEIRNGQPVTKVPSAKS